MQRLNGIWMRLLEVRLRDVSLFIAVTAAVAVLGVFIGRQLGVGGSATAEVTALRQEQPHAEQAQPAMVASSEDSQPATDPKVADSPLSLTISAPDICETDEGFYGYRIAETPVAWTVSGGEPPYRLEIDGDTRDANHEYAGPSGTASVSCALDTGEVHYYGLNINATGQPYRYLAGDYVVDSGTKAIHAVVTDAKGTIASTQINVYVILSTGRADHMLRRGQTYRVFGRLLLTVPEALDFYIGETSSDGTFSLTVAGSDYRAVLWLEDSTFRETYRILPESGSLAALDMRGPVDLNSVFDQLIQSFGSMPTHEHTNR